MNITWLLNVLYITTFENNLSHAFIDIGHRCINYVLYCKAKRREKSEIWRNLYIRLSLFGVQYKIRLYYCKMINALYLWFVFRECYTEDEIVTVILDCNIILSSTISLKNYCAFMFVNTFCLCYLYVMFTCTGLWP